MVESAITPPPKRRPHRHSRPGPRETCEPTGRGTFIQPPGPAPAGDSRGSLAVEVDEAPAQLHPSPREPRAVVPYSTRSYPNARGRTLSRQVVPWRGSKVRPRASAYDRALPRTTARFRVRPRASAYDRAAGRRAQSTGRRGTRESAMSGPAGHRRKPISPRNRIDPGAGDADALRASYECGELDRPRCRGLRRPPGAPAAAPARCSEPVRTAQDAGGRPVPRRRRGRLCR